MNAYLPTDATSVVVVLATMALLLVVGYPISRTSATVPARCISWLLSIVAVGGIDRYTVEQPAGFRMLAIIAVLFYSMKIVVFTEVCLTGKGKLSFWQWIGFAGFWVGMRPNLFARVRRPPRPDVRKYFLRGLKNIAAGLVLVLAARGIWQVTEAWTTNWRLLVITIVMLPGLSLILHFGIFNLLTAFWRSMGAECDAVFRDPLRSKSLTEFWGQRWNTAFSEMTAIAVFRPSRNAWGPLSATMASFLFSGILHELAISFPVSAGFGWPLLYFLLHGVAIVLESRWKALATMLRTRPIASWLWTFAWIVIPMPLLFHQPFLRGCVWPLLGINI